MIPCSCAHDFLKSLVGNERIPSSFDDNTVCHYQAAALAPSDVVDWYIQVVFMIRVKILSDYYTSEAYGMCITDNMIIIKLNCLCFAIHSYCHMAVMI
jgi:tagatose-1,6-bisphosphate aldolase non-catalytic subunit AgaZ/GatZ